MSVWILAVLTFGVSWILTAKSRDYALRHDVMDAPNERSSHQAPTPRGGGIAIVASYSLALIVAFASGLIRLDLLLALILGGAVVAAIGYWDDHRPLPARLRILVHLGAVLLALILLRVWEASFPWNGWLPGWLNVPVLAVFMVWLLNLYNFMDGIDGIAGVEAISVALSVGGLALLSQAWGFAAIMLLLSMAVGGFLVWNWPAAKIFMGDVGSGYLGFILGVLLVGSVKELVIPVGAWVILLGVFFVDATWTLLTRVVTRQVWHQAHRSHAYQNLARKWGSHKRVLLAVVVINLVWLLPAAWILSRYDRWSVIIVVLALLPLAVAAHWLGAGREKW